jgi:hypothetical protein
VAGFGALRRWRETARCVHIGRGVKQWVIKHDSVTQWGAHGIQPVPGVCDGVRAGRRDLGCTCTVEERGLDL